MSYPVAVIGAGFSNSPDGRERWAVRAHVPALKALPDIYDLAAVCTTRMELRLLPPNISTCRTPSTASTAC